MPNKFIAAFLLLPVFGFLSGCSIFAPSMQTVTVSVSEPDAQIFVNGNLQGVGTAQVRVRRNEDVAIMAKKEGFYTTTRTIQPILSTTGILDTIGGCLILVPFFGLMAPGAHKLDSSNITIVMSKELAQK